MKYVNFYSGLALVMIASILGSFGSTTGELAPPLILGFLLLTVLVLGWAGSASAAHTEVDRLTRLEAARQLMAQSHIRQRDDLEAANEDLCAKVKDCQAAIERFSAHAGYLARITSLQVENAELSRRPSAEVMIETAARLMRENSDDEDLDQEYLDGRAAGIVHMHTELAQHMMAPTPVAIDSHPSASTGAVVGKLLPAPMGDSSASSASTASTCGCHACLHIAGTTAEAGMVLCPTCGCKRCPHANDHRHACTGSNEPGQPGSAYPAHVKVLAPGDQS